MGWISSAVNTVVNTVESATGQQGSAAGDPARDAAGRVEDAAHAAAQQAELAAADAAQVMGDLFGTAGSGVQGFGHHVGGRLAGTLGDWLTGVQGQGLPVPDGVDLRDLFELARDVGEVTARRLEDQAVRVAGRGVFDAGRQAAQAGRVPVQTGPAGGWSFVKDVLGDVQRGTTTRLRRVGTKFGARTGRPDPVQVFEAAAQRAGSDGTATWRTIQHAVCASDVAGVAAQIEAEQRRLVAALKRAGQRTGPATSGGARRPMRHRYSTSPTGMQLRGAVEHLAQAATRGGPPDPAAARALAEAAHAAARLAVLAAELRLWLALLARSARRAGPRVLLPLSIDGR